MGLVLHTQVDTPLADVFAWHTRPGAMTRLTPPWLPVHVRQEAASLRDGQAVLGLPGGLTWVAAHEPDSYDPPHRFVDRVVSQPFRTVLRWRHSHEFQEVGEAATLVSDVVDSTVPARRLRPMFAYRHRQLADDLAAHEWGRSYQTQPLTVAMTGAAGLVGTALTAYLTTGGHRVIRLVRRPAEQPDERYWHPEDPDPGLLDGVDAVVHLAGASIAGRFTRTHKYAVRGSRVGPTSALARVAAAGRGPSRFVTASAIGFYGPDRGDEVLTEASSQGGGFLAELVAEWEAATAPAAAAGLRVVQVRTGLVQSPRGGTLRLFRPLYTAGLGGRLGDGQQWMAWIGIDDLLDIYYRAVLDPGLSGPVNAVAPHPVRNQEYNATLARVLHRPARLPVPALGPRLLLGAEGARELAAASQRVHPERLLTAGHRFRHAELEPALRHVLGRTMVT
ncbi:MAG TPA: TIGR01777 family oxidoreductase [Acidimicrobiales bacterium]